MTATAAQLHDAVAAALRESGRYDRLEGEMRRDIFHLLTNDGERAGPPAQDRENYLIDELIREYMQFNGYSNSLSVFVRETGQPADPMDRAFLAQSVGVSPHRLIPILYSMACPDDSVRVVHLPAAGDGNAAPASDDDGFFEIASHP